jgi:hypothetical protein
MIILKTFFLLFHLLKTSFIKNLNLIKLKFQYILFQNIEFVNLILKLKKTRFAF